MVVLGACAGGDESADTTTSSPTTSTTTTEPLFTSEPPEVSIRIRGQAFSENETLAQAYGQYLNAKGYPVRILPAEGRRSEAIEDLVDGEIDLIVDYLGGSQAAVAPDEPLSSDPDETYDVIVEAYEPLGATVLDYARGDNDDAFVVRGDLAATTISDVRELDLVFGAADECFDREQCYLGYTDPAVYDITFAEEVVLDFGPPLGMALSEGRVDAVQWNSTAPQIRDQGLKVLEDDMELHPAQNVVPILADGMLDEFGETLSRDINSLSALITTEVLVQWNVDVDIFGETPAAVALEWLAENRLLDGSMATASRFVAGLQQDLQQLGYYTGPITGVYSLATEDAVLRFQIDNGLPPTGRLDDATAAAIQAALDTQESASVMEAQRILSNLGWYSGPIDGVYSPATVEAVREFQAFLGVTPDGVIGPETIAAFEAQCANPDDCRRPTDTTLPPATTTPPATTSAPTTTPSTSTSPTTTAPSESTTEPTTAAPTTTTPGPTVRLVSPALNTDETYDVQSCTTDTNGDFAQLVARTGAIGLTLDDTTLERDDNGVVTDGQVTTLTLDADGTLDAEGTVNLTGNPAWELTGICANP